MTSKPKFDEDDRRAVVAWLQERCSISLRETMGYKKLFEDANGRLYLVLWAYDEWHGIPEEVLNLGTEKLDGAVLVIAKQYPRRLKIFQGNLAELAQRRNALHSMAGKYDFHTREHSEQMIIEKCAIVLYKLGKFPFGTSEKVASKTRHEILKQFEKLGPAEKTELLERLSGLELQRTSAISRSRRFSTS